jgi:hypothetical protein
MPRRCAICGHPQKNEIDQALVGGETRRAVAKRFACSESALFRHRQKHIPVLLRQAKEAEDRTHADKLQAQAQQQADSGDRHALDVVKQLKAINSASLEVLTEARQARNAETVLKAVDRIQKQIELQSRLLGELDDRTQVTIALVSSPEWLAMRSRIVAALDPFPAAKLAVAEVIDAART